MISKTDAKGVAVSYSYDALNRLTQIIFPDTTQNIVYNYDNCLNGKGRLCKMTDPSGITTYEYSPKGQVTKETKVIDSVQYVTQYTYDMDGNIKTMTYPSGRVIVYNYSNDRAVSVLNNAVNLASNINYKPFGGMSSLTYGNGIAGSISYDNQYRITGITTGTVMNLGYPTYDANGNIKTINDSIDSTKNRTFGYDALDRLTSGTGSWGSLGWTYDGVGNRQAENSNSYTYFANSNKLSSANGKSFGYDNNGNTVTESSRQYNYNQNQRLIQVVDGAMTAGYSYNGNGQRVKKVVNGATTVFHYGLSGQLIAESNSSGAITAEYVYLNSQSLAKIEGANVYYYHNDHLGTPQKMTDGTGTVVWSADYKPFGEATITVSTITNNLRFPGQYFDAETGLNYNYYRDYNPITGTYVQADPIGLEGDDVNIYRYVFNNPINHEDPEGLLCKNRSKPPIMLPWQGTDMPTGAALAALACIEKCIGKGNPWWPSWLPPEDHGTSCSPYDLKITGGSECMQSGKHIPKAKAKKSEHCQNQAFDLPPSYNNMNVKCCAKKCGVTYILNESDHIHMQTRGKGRDNILPSDKDCCSIK